MTDDQKVVCNYIIDRLNGVSVNPKTSGKTEEEVSAWMEGYKSCTLDVVTIISALRDTADIEEE